MSSPSYSSVLAAVRENIEFIAERGWFEPGREGNVFEFPCNPKAEPQGHREAAVLCIIALHHNKPHLLITKRSDNIAFSGDACLPGGSRESRDSSLVETALRETEEEVGLDRGRIEVVCTFPRVFTTLHGGTLISPVVALLRGSTDSLNLSPNPFEVECAYWVPLETFLDDHMESRQIYGNTLYGGKQLKGEGLWLTRVTVKHRDTETGQKHHIWGITGSICTTISAVALNKRPAHSIMYWGISQLVRTGNLLAVTFHSVALTREQVKPLNKL